MHGITLAHHGDREMGNLILRNLDRSMADETAFKTVAVVGAELVEFRNESEHRLIIELGRLWEILP